ncbi:unnamed protein product [Sympodiomycopsis kandeliae]
MALVIVSGLPSSGRTTRCEELIREFQSRISSGSSAGPSRIVHLQDSNIHLPKSTYSSQRSEKPARASYLSLVSRNLTKDSIVIADGGAGLNIKGFRYQLWCAAREVGLICVSVFVSTSKEKCREWNAKRREKGLEAYDEETVSDLFMRYEEPNAMTRWDSPLYVIANDPLPASVDAAPLETTSDGFAKEKWEAAPLDQLWEAVTKGKATKAPNVVTQNRTTSTNYLSLLESSTQSVISSILSYQTSLGGLVPSNGDSIVLTPTINNVNTIKLNLDLPSDKKPPTAPQLQRLRRQFVKIHSTSFATGNILGKESKDEGAGKTSSLEDDVKGSEGVVSPEEKIMKRFVVWLGEILHAQQ